MISDLEPRLSQQMNQDFPFTFATFQPCNLRQVTYTLSLSTLVFTTGWPCTDGHLYVTHHCSLHNGSVTPVIPALLWGDWVSGGLKDFVVKRIKRFTVSQRWCDCHTRQASRSQSWRNDFSVCSLSMGLCFPFYQPHEGSESLDTLSECLSSRKVFF